MARKLTSAAAALVVATAIGASGAATRADVIHRCLPGSDEPDYCVTARVCKVPNVVGKHLNTAERLIAKHDCRVGKVHRERPKRQRGRGYRYGGGVVVRQSPRPGGTYSRGHKVNLLVYV